jgi:hypothetical protein
MVISEKYYAQRILAVVRKNYVFKLFFIVWKNCKYNIGLGNAHPAFCNTFL